MSVPFQIPADPEIKWFPGKKMIGLRRSMTFAENKTPELWRDFMTRRHEIKNAIDNDLYSIQNYPPSFFNPFNPMATFEKWAAKEVIDFDFVPDGMEILILPESEYAVFIYRGDARNASAFFQYIFSKWLPASGYTLDIRHHFEILGEKYKRNDPDSEEEVWIPITPYRAGLITS